jgi:hypothetical protein
MRPAAPDDEFRGHWLQFPARTFLVDNTPAAPPCSVELRAAGEVVVIDIGNGAAKLRVGADPTAEAVVTATPAQVLALMSGGLSVRKAVTQGVQVEGSVAAVERMLPSRRRADGTAVRQSKEHPRRGAQTTA